MIPSAESIRVMRPLFQAVEGGSIPTSALQLLMHWIGMDIAVHLNWAWHSTLPSFTSPPEKCKAIGAEHDGRLYAVAIWSPPVARKLNWTGRYELRRFAIAPDAPRFTGSRMLRVMALLIARHRKFADVHTLMSYQDKDSHMGVIYRAAGWKEAAETKCQRKAGIRARAATPRRPTPQRCDGSTPCIALPRGRRHDP